MKTKDIEQRILTMTGSQLLEELSVSAALRLTKHVTGELTQDDAASLIRTIQARLAETGVARKFHGEACRFLLGGTYCPCSVAHWSWPRQGLNDPAIGGGEPR